MTTARAHHTATLLNSGKVLITGGFIVGADGNQIYLASSELYDPASGAFTLTGSRAYPGLSPTAAASLPSGLVLSRTTCTIFDTLDKAVVPRGSAIP